MFRWKEINVLSFAVLNIILIAGNAAQTEWESCSDHLIKRTPVTCDDVTDYVTCAIRALGPTSQGVELMTDNINNIIRESQGQAFLDCDLDARKLLEKVRKEEAWAEEGEESDWTSQKGRHRGHGSAELPAEFGDLQKGRNDQCIERYFEDLVGIKDRHQMCEPTKHLLLCMFEAAGIDINEHLSEYERDYIESMMEREMKRLGLHCDFDLDSLIQEEKENHFEIAKVTYPLIGVLVTLIFLVVVFRMFIVRQRLQARRTRAQARPYTIPCAPSTISGPQTPAGGPLAQLPAYDAPYEPPAGAPPGYSLACAPPPPYASLAPQSKEGHEYSNLQEGVNPVYDTIDEKN